MRRALKELRADQRNLRHRSKQGLSESGGRKLWKKLRFQPRKERFIHLWLSFFHRVSFLRISSNIDLYWMFYFRGVSFPRINMLPKLNGTTSQSEPELISQIKYSIQFFRLPFHNISVFKSNSGKGRPDFGKNVKVFCERLGFCAPFVTKPDRSHMVVLHIR